MVDVQVEALRHRPVAPSGERDATVTDDVSTVAVAHFRNDMKLDCLDAAFALFANALGSLGCRYRYRAMKLGIVRDALRRR
jgi:hypothetical protein